MWKKISLFLFVILFSFNSYAGEVKQKTLHLVTALDPVEAEQYINEFEKDSGIDVRWVKLSTGETLARLKAEKNNPTQSLWFGGTVPEYVAAQGEGLLYKYRAPDTSMIQEKFRDKEGYWTGIYFGALGFVSNKEFLEKYNVPPPTSWEDLLNPVFKKRIVMSLPYTAGTGYTILSTFIALYGEEKAFDFYKRLSPQIHHYTKAGWAPVLVVGLGEAAIGVAFAHDIERKAVKRGYPVVLSYPKEGTGHEIGGVAIINGAKELYEAMKFVDWILSEKAQGLMPKFYRSPLREFKETELKLVDLDFKKVGEGRHDLVLKWRKIVER